ncbi:MAG: hypothetical protein PHE09_16570 [Oscillospiraceae bacterium]|nr:hypothetical protein [Oscillospiraceae bacterium]
MLPKDNFYDLILTHRLPVSRGTQTVKAFLQAYFTEYIGSFKMALNRTEECTLREECYALLSSKVPILEELCADILSVFDYYDSADMKTLYTHFSTMMDKIEPLLFTKSIGNVGYELYRSYYRIRAGKDRFQRIDLFHISMNKRHLIKSYRYSIPGYPCLYLSSGLEMCWFECGMPKEFSYAAFNLEATDDDPVNLIDFTIQPVDLVSSVSISYHNHPEDSSLIDAFVAKYLLSFPLRVACSLEVANRDVSFVEEYIFPQQLLLWVRENKTYDGIAYRTCSAVERAREWNYINLVMPAKELENGYCVHLNKLFTVTDPVKVEIRSIVQSYQSKIQDVKVFLAMIEPKYYHGYSIYPYRELISLCKTFLLLSDMLLHDNYKNPEAIYQSMDTLNLLSYLAIENKESIKGKSLAEAKGLFCGVDETILTNEFDLVMKEFAEKVKPAFFELWSYVSRISCNTAVDPSTYQHVL